MVIALNFILSGIYYIKSYKLCHKYLLLSEDDALVYYYNTPNKAGGFLDYYLVILWMPYTQNLIFEMTVVYYICKDLSLPRNMFLCVFF